MIEHLQSLLKALEAGSYSTQPKPAENRQMINGHKALGKCKLIITNEDGETVMNAEVFLKSYDMRHERDSIHVMGEYSAVEYIPRNMELTLTCSVAPTPVKVEPVVTHKAREMSDSEFLGILTGDVVASSTPIHAVTSFANGCSHKCDHTWKKYEGFMDRYDYCEKCNEKRES
jgi:hypothetical protein